MTSRLLMLPLFHFDPEDGDKFSCETGPLGLNSRCDPSMQ
jgi:hypothetical protein